jgi:3-hydroxymyristoyl/3-hydroxydecanoyl-(acyl carrier protein) dehydratase
MRWLFVRRIDDLVPGKEVRGVASFDPTLPLFQDHFPGWPVVPGVVLLETLAQISGKLIGYSVRAQRGDWPFPILSMMDGVKFRRFVRPGQEVLLHATLEALREESAAVAVYARVDGKVVAQAHQVFVFNAVPLANPDDAERLERLEGEELARLWSGFDPSVWAP